MVTATRRSTFSKTEEGSATSTPTRRSPAANGKRKSISPTPEVQDSHARASKRRKRPQVEVVINTGTVNSKSSSPDPTKARRFQVLDRVEVMSPRGSQPSTREPSDVPSEELARDNTPSTKRMSKKQTKSKKPAKSAEPAKPAKPESNVKSTHMRFDSEEPVPIVEEEKQVEKVEEEPQDNQEDSDDDDAPEAISNVTQLQQLKGEERKREQATQQLEQKEKEKRREHARRLQSQAASKPRRMSPPALPTAQLQKQKHDEIMSESSATLQGSETKATSPSTLKASLPMLLPDDILNAEPSTRPPTPPREKLNFAVKASSNKIRFLDTVQKPLKDIRVGNTSVRVLDEMTQFNSRTGANNRLAPKASKAGKNQKDRWISGRRNTNVSGLRRTTGGTSGFVKK